MLGPKTCDYVSDISVINGLVIWILFMGNLIRLLGAYAPLPKNIYISNY
jgi:hypothetical protein